MPKDVKTGSKEISGVLDNHTYPSSVDDMMSSDTPFEGTENSLPGKETNPIMGADGKLPMVKISKIVG